MTDPSQPNDKTGRNNYHHVDSAGDFLSQSTGAKRTATQTTYPHVSAQQQRQHHAPIRTSTQIASLQNKEGPRSAVTDVLPYCTTEPPLTQERVIALSDVAGSVKELALLALAASAGDSASMSSLVIAVGSTTTAINIIDFFADEWEIEG